MTQWIQTEYFTTTLGASEQNNAQANRLGAVQYGFIEIDQPFFFIRQSVTLNGQLQTCCKGFSQKCSARATNMAMMTGGRRANVVVRPKLLLGLLHCFYMFRVMFTTVTRGPTESLSSRTESHLHPKGTCHKNQ